MSRTREEWETLIRQYIEHCFQTGTPPRVAAMARRLGISREGLTRTLTEATGRPPAHAFRDLQLERAAELLAGTGHTTAEIARLAAFGSARAFYRTFLRCVGITPSEFRRRSQSPEARSEPATRGGNGGRPG